MGQSGAIRGELYWRSAPDRLQAFARSITVEVLSRQRTPGTLAEHVQRLGETLDPIVAEYLQETGKRPQCASGCSWCCHILVRVHAAEVICLSEYIKRQCRRPQALNNLDAIRTQVAAIAAATHGLTWWERERTSLPCPLLCSDGRCFVYHVRPMACRGWNSFSAEDCRLAHQAPGSRLVTFEATLVNLSLSVRLGLGEGLADIGLGADDTGLELATALDIALSTPESAERWLDGEPVFAQARIPQ